MDDARAQAAVRASLDGALEDLLRSAVEAGLEPYAISCARIDAAFDSRMVPYRQLSWAMDEAATLKCALKQGLQRRVDGSEDQSSKVRKS